MERIKEEYEEVLRKYSNVLNGLDSTIKQTREHLEGNLFYQDHDFWEQFVMTPLFANSRYNLFNYAKSAQNILEIGFNGGHSCFLYLISNPTSKVQLFDLGNHSYARPCYEYLSSVFPNRLSMIWGDSTSSVSSFNTWVKYDLIHIDGGHARNVAESDLNNCKRFSSSETVVVLDDYSVEPLTSIFNENLQKGVISKRDTVFNSEHQLVVRYNDVPKREAVLRETEYHQKNIWTL